MTGCNRDTVWTWNAIGKRKGAWNLDPDAEETAGLLVARLVRWEQIATVRIGGDHKLAEITLQDGKAVLGRIVSEKVRLTTVIGSLSVPWAKITELTIDRPRPPPAAPAHLLRHHDKEAGFSSEWRRKEPPQAAHGGLFGG